MNRVFVGQPNATQQSCSFVIKNVNFLGGNVSCTGLELESTTNTVIENCTFTSLTNGLVLNNATNVSVNNCVTTNITSVSYKTGYPSWGDKNSNYSSNITFTQCSANGRLSQMAGFHILATPRAVLNECTSSGTTLYHVYYQAMTGPSSGTYNLNNNFKINNLTLNSAATSAGIRAELSEGFAKIDGLYSVYDGILIDAFASVSGSSPKLYVYNVPYLNSNTVFKTDGGYIPGCSSYNPQDSVVWEFKEIYDPANIFSSTRWYEGYIPFYRLSDNFSYSSYSKQYLTNFMRINNKTVSQ
jgi:hypothetical protein